MKRELTVLVKAEAVVLLQALAVIAGSAIFLMAYLRFGVHEFPFTLGSGQPPTTLIREMPDGMPSPSGRSPTGATPSSSSAQPTFAPPDNRQTNRTKPVLPVVATPVYPMRFFTRSSVYGSRLPPVRIVVTPHPRYRRGKLKACSGYIGMPPPDG
jgi:hypothetical protein